MMRLSGIDPSHPTWLAALYRARGLARGQGRMRLRNAARLRSRTLGDAAASTLPALTVLQHRVIQRLRISGHTALAAEALDAWLAGRALECVYLGGDQERRAEFDRANEHARRGP